MTTGGRSNRAKKHSAQLRAAKNRKGPTAPKNPTGPLPSHRRKLARAETHIQEVERLIKGWANDGNAYKIAVEANDEGHIEVFGEQLKPIPDQLELVIGDALQAMRSSLDNLAFALAFKKTPTMTAKEEGGVSFPIFDEPASIADRSVKLMDGVVIGKVSVPKMPSKVLTLLIRIRG